MDSAFYNADVVAAARRAGAKVSITARMNKDVTAAIAGIDQTAWTPIKYPNAIYDEDEQITDQDGASPVPTYTSPASRFFVYGRDGACPVLVPKPLSRSFSLRFAQVGSLYLLRIARENAVVGGAREIYGS